MRTRGFIVSAFIVSGLVIAMTGPAFAAQLNLTQTEKEDILLRCVKAGGTMKACCAAADGKMSSSGSCTVKGDPQSSTVNPVPAVRAPTVFGKGKGKGTVAPSLQQGTVAPIAPGKNIGTVGTFSGVIELTESDCRLDGGTVVKPGDDRCGSFGAVYCRKANGEAACINEQ